MPSRADQPTAATGASAAATTLAAPTPTGTAAVIAAADPCVHCGFCLPTCASYRVLATEMDSPRGRIHTLKAIEAGTLTLDATVAGHFDSCLGCFACVTACPSGVRYDQLIEATRPKLNAPELRTPAQRAFRRLLFSLLPYPNRLRAALTPLRAYAGTPLQALARRSGLTRLFGPQVEALEGLLPPLAPEAFRDELPVVVPAEGERRYRVGLVLGCVQRLFDPAVNAAAIRVLSANGIEVVIPPDQGCCGAVTHHQGELEQTCTLATDLMASFAAVIGEGGAAGPEPLDAVLVAASGCGHTLKHYGTILADAPPQTGGALGSSAASCGEGPDPAAFALQVADIQEFLDRVGPSPAFRAALQPLRHPDGSPATAERPLRLAYHDACHMLHGQGLRQQPRSLLAAIPHVRLVEATEAGVCCGSAGIYNLVQPEEAAELGRIKATDLAGTGADLAVSANIGCTLQIRRHMEATPRPIPVLHPVQLLLRSLEGDDTTRPPSPPAPSRPLATASDPGVPRPSRPEALQSPAPRRRRLVNALLLASAVPMTLLSLGIGAINWWNGQRTAATLAESLGTSITEQVRLQLDQLLAVPRQINALNASAIREGRLDPDDFPRLARTFISQMAVFPAGYINYGNEAGEYVGIERLDSGALQLNLTDRRRGLQRQYVYAVGPQGPASQPLTVYDQMSPATEEAWYAETVRADKPTWSSIYQWDDKPEVLSVSFNEPVRHPDGRLRGVIGVDFILTQLNSKLARIWGQRSGLVVITERNGRLVASSNGNTIETGIGKAPERRWITQSVNPLEREAGQLLFSAGSGPRRLNEALVQRSTSRRTNEQLATASSYVEVLPWSDSHGLNWVVLVIIPRQSLTGAIQQQTLLTSLLGLVALLILLLLSGRVTRSILRPLEELSEGARQVGEAIRRSPGAPLQFNTTLTGGSAQEIENLGGAMGGLIANFNGLVNALQRSSNRLERELDQKARALDQATRREQDELASRRAREGFLGQLGTAMLHPLADLRGAARLARRESNPQRLLQQLDRLESSAHRLEHLAHNLHDHARLADGALSLRIAPLALPELLESSTEAQRSAARARGVALDWRIAAGTPETLEGDRVRLQQVLEHLLAQAIRQAHGGAVRLEASTTGGPEPRLLLRVRSDGPRLGNAASGGPAPAGNALSPGREAQSVEDLGPSVCQRLVALMGGSISPDDPSDPGSGGSLELPLDPEPTPAAIP